MAFTRYSASQAAARAKGFTTWRTGYCLNFVWHCTDYPDVAGLGTANEAWSRAAQKVSTGNPPAGAPVYWAGGKYGHIAVSIGNGYVRSTDWPSKGRVGTVKITTLTSQWGLKYRGWSRDYAGQPILGLQTASSYPATMAVDLSSPITVAKLRPGYSNPDVARFEAAMWNYLGGPYRAKIIASKGAVGDGFYGTLTQTMCSDSYAKAGLPRATYPGGKVLLSVLGFKDIRA